MNPLRTAKGGIAVSDELTSKIADALATTGEYIARIELVPTQQLVDFHWAAHQAGRYLGPKVTIDVNILKDDAGAEVRVGPRRRHGPR